MAVDRFPVEAGHVVAFARSIGDSNAEAAISTPCALAPATFVQAAAQFDDEFPSRPKPGVPWFGSGRDATVASTVDTGRATGRRLHAEQHFEYHRPLRVGDVLHVVVMPGRRWDRVGRRAGPMTMEETVTEFRDAEGELVVTARNLVAILHPAGEDASSH